MEYTDWATIIAITKNEKLVMERQYRHGLQTIGLELCGGTVEKGEDILAAAKREILKETGFSDGEWTEYAPTAPNPSAMTNICHTFIVKGVRKVSDQILDKTKT